MKKQRIEYFDAAKGIAIIAVIVGHMGLIARGMTLTERFIFSFHMPIFKNVDSCGDVWRWIRP